MIRLLFGFVLAALPATAAQATVLRAGAINGVETAVTPASERAFADTVTLRNDNTGALVRRIRADEAFDGIMMSAAGLGSPSDMLAPGTRVTLASARAGTGVRSGNAAPDIGTAGSVRRAMLHARAVAYIDPASGASSGIYTAKLFQTLGIAQAMAPKSVLVHGGLAATAVTGGRADIALQQGTEIVSVPGVALAGPLPDAIQIRTVCVGAHAAGARDITAAAAFLHAGSEPVARNAMATPRLTAR